MVRVTTKGTTSSSKLLLLLNSWSRRDVLMMTLGATVAWLVSVASSSSSSFTLEQSLPLSTLAARRAAEGAVSVVPVVVPDNNNNNGNDQPASGWKSIHVFYGDRRQLTDPIPNSHWLLQKDVNVDNTKSKKTKKTHTSDQKWFSQHGQDVAVQKVLGFKKAGFFVDLAANDAVWASNTFALEHNFHWRGICIEANPFYWYRLAFRTCHVVGAIAGKQNMEDVQVQLGQAKGSGPFGGIVGGDFDNKKTKEAEHRFTVTLQTMLQLWDAPAVIDYLSLDVEGAETFIMKDFAWSDYTFLCLTIERPTDELKAILTANHYHKVLDIKRGDTLWVHSSIRDQAVLNLAQNPDDIQKHAVQVFPPGTKPE